MIISQDVCLHEFPQSPFVFHQNAMYCEIAWTQTFQECFEFITVHQSNCCIFRSSHDTTNGLVFLLVLKPMFMDPVILTNGLSVGGLPSERDAQIGGLISLKISLIGENWVPPIYFKWNAFGFHFQRLDSERRWSSLATRLAREWGTANNVIPRG